MDRLSQLPSETLWKILSYVNVQELSCIRMVNKKLAVFADHPSHWRDLQLAPPQEKVTSSKTTLWNLKELQHLIGPHRKIIESIQIWGVRDDIVRYILSQCMNLTDLTLCGWVTLSDHAFKQLHPNLNLQRLVLVGAQEQLNYTAMDATTLAHLLVQCPLKELSLSCQVHIHAETLLLELNKRQKQYRRQHNASTTQEKKTPSTSLLTVVPLPLANKHTASTYTKEDIHTSDILVGSPLQLQRLTLATQRTWSPEHVMALFDTCPSLHYVCLFPAAAAAAGFDLVQTKENMS